MLLHMIVVVVFVVVVVVVVVFVFVIWQILDSQRTMKHIPLN